jgi:hypothetical protein
MTEPAAGSPAKIRILSALLLGLIVICLPFALMMAGMSVMASDSGVSSGATAFVSVMWIGLLVMVIAALLALAALVVASRKLLIWAAALTALPVLAVLAMLVLAGA